MRAAPERGFGEGAAQLIEHACGLRRARAPQQFFDAVQPQLQHRDMPHLAPGALARSFSPRAPGTGLFVFRGGLYRVFSGRSDDRTLIDRLGPECAFARDLRAARGSG